MGPDELDPTATSSGHETGPGQSTAWAGRDYAARVRELRVAHRAHRIRRHRSLVLYWLGRRLRRIRPAQRAQLPAVQAGQVAISFAGHATVLIRYADCSIVCDPVLARSVKGIKRAVAPGLEPGDLASVDLVLVSHDHADHLDRATLAILPRTATVIVPPRVARRVSDLGFARVIEMRAGQSFRDHGVTLATAAVRHGDPRAPALSYVVRGHGPSVYFCGDSGYFSGFAEIGARHAPDIAILPIGGYAPLSFRDRHMSPLDALYALEDLGARVLIPIHHGAFALSYEELDEPSRWLAELCRERGLEEFVIELLPGESRVFVPPRSASVARSTPASLGSPHIGEDDELARLVAASGELVLSREGHDARPLPEMPAYVRMQTLPRPRTHWVDLPADGLGTPIIAPG